MFFMQRSQFLHVFCKPSSSNAISRRFLMPWFCILFKAEFFISQVMPSTERICCKNRPHYWTACDIRNCERYLKTRSFLFAVLLPKTIHLCQTFVFDTLRFVFDEFRAIRDTGASYDEQKIN